MNNQEARFILGAYRPDGRDAGDSKFAAALEQAQRDPDLRAWLERQRAFDVALAGKLREVLPPPELREAILAGVRATQPRRSWWTNPAWFAAAAGIAVVTILSFSVAPSGAAPSIAEFTGVAIKDLADAHDEHVGYPLEFAGLQSRLSAVESPLRRAAEANIDLDELRRKNCRSLRVAGREVFEICFERDGVWYHLYAARRNDFAPGNIDPNTSIASREGYSATAWTDSKHVYALVARTDGETLRRLI
jgi:hypothetical protein